MTQPILTDIPMESFLSHIDAVAGAIAKSDWRPDYIVGVGRGGLVPATYLSHAISQPMLSVDLSAQVAGFCDELLDKLVAMALEGSRLLFVDDINDSGRTINQLRAALAGARRSSALCRADRQCQLGREGRISRGHDRPCRHQGLVRLPLGSGRQPCVDPVRLGEVPERTS